MELLLFLFIVLICFICLLLSTPIHEISHYLFFKTMGCKTKLVIKLFQFSRESLGYIEAADGSDFYEFPKIFKNHYRIFVFFLGLSGGLGAALTILISLFVLYYFSIFENPIFERRFIILPLIFVMIFQFFYGIVEAIGSCKTARLVKSSKFLFEMKS